MSDELKPKHNMRQVAVRLGELVPDATRVTICHDYNTLDFGTVTIEGKWIIRREDAYLVHEALREKVAAT